jgi:Luciferase-like monooxygenase
MRIGYKLATEGFGPKELIRQAVLAEQVGFDFVEMSDHYHPWVEAQGHSAFTWSLLSAIAMKTDRIGLATGVTCPSVRYHPAIIAQAAATLAIISDGLFAVEPDADLVTTWHGLGGHGPAYGEMPLAWAQDEDKAVAAVLEKNTFALSGWKVMAELPNPVNFEAVTTLATPEQVREQFACGPDPKRHLGIARRFADAGFDHVVAMNAGTDPDGFMDFFARELAAPLRALTPATA